MDRQKCINFRAPRFISCTWPYTNYLRIGLCVLGGYEIKIDMICVGRQLVGCVFQCLMEIKTIRAYIIDYPGSDDGQHTIAIARTTPMSSKAKFGFVVVCDVWGFVFNLCGRYILLLMPSFFNV